MPEDNFSIKETLEHYFAQMDKRMDRQDASLVDISTKVGIQNGRMTKIETWSNEAKAIIENNSKVLAKYKSDKGKIWVAISMLTLLGGTIIGLSIMAIDSKIQRAVGAAFDAKFDKIEVTK